MDVVADISWRHVRVGLLYIPKIMLVSVSYTEYDIMSFYVMDASRSIS